MIVMRQDIGDPLLPHRLHGDAVGQAVLLVRAGLVEGESGLKGMIGLRDHDDVWVGGDLMNAAGGDAA